MKATLTAAQIEIVLQANPGWKLQDGKLIRTLTFPDFPEAIAFVNRLAPIAEAAQHHPDIDIRYNKVQLAIISHDAGGITDRDADMVHRLSSLL
jgi:4a-hydroxytetrahydrobiopterin dehydratase